MFDESDLQRIREQKDEWEAETLDPVLDAYGERKEQFATVSNLDVDRLYTPLDVDDVDYEEDIGFPGEEPFTRGVYPTMYRGRQWTMRQFAGFGTADETNERFHYLIDEGQTGLSTAFDMPTLMGIDSDDVMADGEVGKEGVAVDTLADMERLFDGIDLGEVSTSFTINPAPPSSTRCTSRWPTSRASRARRSAEPYRTICSRSSSHRRSGSFRRSRR